jgi:hypothetical protein
MFSQIKQAVCLLSIGVVGILGCSQGNAAKTADPPPQVLLNSDVPQTPEAAVKAVQDGLKASKPVVVWDAMTGTNQAAYNKMVRDIAEQIDPEIWNRTVANLNKLVRLAETKKDFILASPLLQSSKQIDLKDVKANWSPGLNLLKTILQSELVDQEKMKNFDGRAFLEGTGAKLYAQARELTKSMKNDPLKQIDEWKARVVTSSDRSANLTLESPDPKRKPIEIPLIVLEGKWTTDRFQFLPYLVGSRLNPIMNRFRPYELVEWKDEYLADMQRIEKILDQLQAAKTSDDFQGLVSLRVLPYVLQKTVQLNQKPKPWSRLEAASQARPKATVMVIIKGEHFGDEPAMLDLLKVFRAVEASGNGSLSGPLKIDGSTTFLVSPVTDTDGFSKKIQVGKITKIDVKRNTVSVELPLSPADDKATANADGAAKSPAP